MKVYVMRGINGAGKTKWVNDWINENEAADTFICSAKSHFVNSAGMYVYDHFHLNAVHNRCMYQFIDELVGAECDPVIFVDNSNLTLAELAPYVAVAQAYGVTVEAVQIDTDAKLAFGRQQHSVPEEQFRQHVATEQRARGAIIRYLNLRKVKLHIFRG